MGSGKIYYIHISTKQLGNSDTVIMVEILILESLEVKDYCLVCYCLNILSSLVKASVCVEAPYAACSRSHDTCEQSICAFEINF